MSDGTSASRGLLQRQQIFNEVVEVLLAHPAVQPARHRVRIPRHDVRAGIADRLADVVLRADAGLALARKRADVREWRPDGPAIGADGVTARAVLLAVDLPAALDRVGRLWLRTSGREHARR